MRLFFTQKAPPPPPPPPPPTPYTPQTLAEVIARTLNLRAGPGVDQPVIAQLHRGDQVQLLGRTENSQWLKIATEQAEFGWAAARWLKADIPLDELPVLARATTRVPAPAPAPRGRILFQDRPGGDIYLIDASGRGLKRLAAGLDPAFSPDGEQIAFARWDGDGDAIMVIGVDGRGQRVVVQDNKPRSPTWSPDGQKLIYDRLDKIQSCRSTPFGCLTDDELRWRFSGHDCMTTPRGALCIDDFPPVHRTVTSLKAIILPETRLVDVPATPYAVAPRHHPTLPRALYLGHAGMAVAFTEGDRPPQAIAAYDEFGAPVYSPDGRYIYVSRRDGDSWNIWRYNADGREPTPLTHTPGLRQRPIDNVAPAASSDGRFIVFLTDRNGPWQLWIMDSDGGNQRPFAPQALSNIEFQFDFSRARMTDWK